MSSPLSFHGFALEKLGLTAGFALSPGQLLAVAGPAGSGKSRFVAACLGEIQPARGSVKRAKEILRPPERVTRRQQPLTLAQSHNGSDGASRATDALVATGLWDSRKASAAELSAGQLAACRLLPSLSGRARLIVIDGLLDELDPWALARVLELLFRRMVEGASVVLATNRLAVIGEADWLVLLNKSQIKYAGKVSGLNADSLESITVATGNPVTARTMSAPLELTVEARPGELTLSAPDGQQVAAKLLLEGYGDVKSVVVRKRPLEDVLAAYLNSP